MRPSMRTRRQRQLAVRTLAGFAGNHTAPDALKRLAKLGKVRLVDGHALFHVKLILFRGSRKSLAWVGSANFTGPGFERNEELIYETEETDDLQDWFDSRWKETGPQPDQPAAYCTKWKTPAFPREEVDGRRQQKAQRGRKKSAATQVDDGRNAIVFKQKGVRPPPKDGKANKKAPPRGVVAIGEKQYEYSSAQVCCRSCSTRCSKGTVRS